MLNEQLKSIIQNNGLSHAYFLEGGYGVKVAKTLAGVQLNPEGQSMITSRIDNLNHPDVVWVSPDGVAIKIDQIREMASKVCFKSIEGNGQVVVIEQADKMNVQASNALLKLLEEPKDGLMFILLGTSSDKLLTTIRSRVQIIRLTEQDNFVQLVHEKGLSFQYLSVLEELHLSIDVVEKYADKLDNWVGLVEATMNQPRLQSLLSVQSWATQFEDPQQKQISILLLQSYGRALVSVKKGEYIRWETVPLKNWPEIVLFNQSVHALSAAIHSRGQYLLQLEQFIKNIHSKDGIVA